MSESIPWQKAEKRAKEYLKKKFKKNFSKQKLLIGGNEWEFDCVSEDKTIVAQVKLRKKNVKSSRGKFVREVHDCLLLEKVKAKKRIFFFVSKKKFFEKFKRDTKGLISKKVEISDGKGG